MTTNHHTDISVGAAVDASVVNAPDGQLDSAITQMLNGSKAFAQLNFTDTTLVLASDSITVTNSAHRVDTGFSILYGSKFCKARHPSRLCH